MHGSWDMEHDRQKFLSFFIPNHLENQNFEKIKTKQGDIIILHK